jgi:hypothetical protein
MISTVRSTSPWLPRDQYACHSRLHQYVCFSVVSHDLNRVEGKGILSGILSLKVIEASEQ